MKLLVVKSVGAIAMALALWFAVATSVDSEAAVFQPGEVVLSVTTFAVVLGALQASIILRTVFYAFGHVDSGRSWLERRSESFGGPTKSDGFRRISKRLTLNALKFLASPKLYLGAVIISALAISSTLISAVSEFYVSRFANVQICLLIAALVISLSAVGRLLLSTTLYAAPSLSRRIVCLGDLPSDIPSVSGLRNRDARDFGQRLRDPSVLIVFAISILMVLLPAIGIEGVTLGVLVVIGVGHLGYTNLQLFVASRGWWRKISKSESVPRSTRPPTQRTRPPTQRTRPPTQRTVVEIITPIGPNSPIAELGGVLSDHRLLELSPVRWTVVTDPDRVEDADEFLRSHFAMHGADAALDRVRVMASESPKVGPKRTLAATYSTAPYLVFIDSDDRIDVSRLLTAASAALSRPMALQSVHLFPYYLQTVDGLGIRNPIVGAEGPVVHHHCARLWPSGLFQSGRFFYGHHDFEDAIFTLEMAMLIDYHRHTVTETAFLTYADHKNAKGRLTRSYKDSTDLMRRFADHAIAEAKREILPKPSPRERLLLNVMVRRIAAEVAWGRSPMFDLLADNLSEYRRYRDLRPDLEIDLKEIEVSATGVRKRMGSEGALGDGLMHFLRDEMASRWSRSALLRDAGDSLGAADKQLGLFVGLMNADLTELRSDETTPTVFYNLPGSDQALRRRTLSFYLRAPHFRLKDDKSLPIGAVEFYDPISKSRSYLGNFQTDRFMSSKLLRLWDRFYPTFNQVEQSRSSVTLQSLARRSKISTIRMVATGPSSTAARGLEEVDETVLTICCNSWVRQPDRMARMGAKILTAGDPIFHAGPSEYAQTFRADVTAWLRRDPENLFVTVSRDIAIYLAEMPEDVHNQIVALVFDSKVDPVHPTFIDTGRIQPYPNIMTMLMLPMAELFQPEEIHLFGFDGGATGANEFWKYDPEVNYSVDLQQTVRSWHPEFFRLEYQDYRDAHDDHVASWFDRLANGGAVLEAAAPSNIPAVHAAFERKAVAGEGSR